MIRSRAYSTLIFFKENLLPELNKWFLVWKLYPSYQLDFHPPNKANLGCKDTLTVCDESSRYALDVVIFPTSSK